MQLSSRQLGDVVRLLDELAVWSRRSKYGRFRPPGWRTVLQRQQASGDARRAEATPSTRAAAADEAGEARGSPTAAAAAVGKATPPGSGGPSRASTSPDRRSAGGESDSSSGLGSSEGPAEQQEQQDVQQLLDRQASHAAASSSGGAAAVQQAPRGAVLSALPAIGSEAELSSIGASRSPSPRPQHARQPPPQQHTAPVSWRQVWRYAIKAVLSDLRRGPNIISPAAQRQYLQRRRRYVQLYSGRLEQLSRPGAGWGGQASELQQELQHLERKLSVSDIMLFRSLAEAAVEQAGGWRRRLAACTSALGAVHAGCAVCIDAGLKVGPPLPLGRPPTLPAALPCCPLSRRRDGHGALGQLAGLGHVGRVGLHRRRRGARGASRAAS
jgi:hypothetical protein